MGASRKALPLSSPPPASDRLWLREARAQVAVVPSPASMPRRPPHCGAVFCTGLSVSSVSSGFVTVTTKVTETRAEMSFVL